MSECVCVCVRVFRTCDGGGGGFSAIIWLHGEALDLKLNARRGKGMCCCFWWILTLNWWFFKNRFFPPWPPIPGGLWNLPSSLNWDTITTQHWTHSLAHAANKHDRAKSSYLYTSTQKIGSVDVYFGSSEKSLVSRAVISFILLFLFSSAKNPKRKLSKNWKILC